MKPQFITVEQILGDKTTPTRINTRLINYYYAVETTHNGKRITVTRIVFGANMILVKNTLKDIALLIEYTW